MAKARQQTPNRSEQLVQFRHEDVQRIANVVGWYESTPRGRRASSLPRAPGGGTVFRICDFTGAWNINSDKTVTFKFQTTTPNTVVVTNLFASLTAASGSTSKRNCAIAKEGTAWYLIAAQC